MTKCNAGVPPGELACGGQLQPGDMHLHFSGYDPRAAGGRQTIKLELRGILAQALPLSCAQLEVHLRSDLIAPGQTRQHFVRAPSGQWRPLVIGFSSKNKEYGQYQIEVEVGIDHRAAGACRRRWTCTAVILVPRPDATLTEIHRVFLHAQKNVKVFASDGSIAKLSGFGAYAQGDMALDINANNAAIAQVDLSAPAGKYEIAPGSIAWDEELIEELIEECMADRPEATPAQPIAPLPQTDASTPTHQGTGVGLIRSPHQEWRQIRLFALDHWVLGRLELHHPKADILLAHIGKDQAASALLTRRISARHAIIRRCGDAAQITDISRYGLLLDGVAQEKGLPVALCAGMQIELCASVRGIIFLRVRAILGHVVILQHNGQDANGELFYLLTPEARPERFSQNFPDSLPQVFHAQGIFWHVDSHTGQETALSAGAIDDALENLAPGSSFVGVPSSLSDLGVVGCKIT